MANKVSIPSIIGNTENIPFNLLVWLQAVEDAIKTIDTNVVYKDQVTGSIAAPTITALTAQGQAFSVNGQNLASGDDYVALVSNVQALVQSNTALTTAVSNVVKEIQGK